MVFRYAIATGRAERDPLGRFSWSIDYSRSSIARPIIEPWALVHCCVLSMGLTDNRRPGPHCSSLRSFLSDRVSSAMPNGKSLISTKQNGLSLLKK